MISFLFSYIFLVTFYQVWALMSAAQSLRAPSFYPQRSSPWGDVVDVKVYYESLCQACQHEVSQDLTKVSRLLGDQVNMELIPYGKCKTYFANDTWMFDAQHGPAEVYGNKLHNCALDMLDPRTSLFFNACLMTGPDKGSNDNSVDQCAASFGINGEAIKQCAKSTKGSLLLKAAGEKTPRLSQVPYAIINGVPCLDNVFEGVCKAFVNPPAVCRGIY